MQQSVSLSLCLSSLHKPNHVVSAAFHQQYRETYRGWRGRETEWKEKTGPGHTVTVCVSLCWRFESKSEVSLKGGRFEEKRFLHLKKEQIVLGSPSELSVTVTNQVQTEQMRSFRRCSPRKKTPTLPASPVDHLCASRLTSCCPPTSPLPGNKRQHTRAVS